MDRGRIFRQHRFGRSGYYQDESWECQELNRTYCKQSSSEVQEAKRKRGSFSLETYPHSRSPDRNCRRRYSYRSESEKRHDIREVDHTKPHPKPEWPPQFETSGAAYVFDANSGFFYETASDFFYDPKTKWYYGNKQRTYFTYAAGEEPPFRPISIDTSVVDTKNVIQSEEKVLSCTTGATTSATTTSGAGKAGKKKISICLKRKTLGITVTLATESSPVMGATTSETAMEIPPSSSPRPVLVETVPKAPLVEASYATNTAAETPVQQTLISSLNPEKQSKATTIKTNGKPPVCLLCKRKFANMEKLKLHNELSALHKQNLLKKAAVDAKNDPKQM